MTEPVVVHHGREQGGLGPRRRAADCCNGLLGGRLRSACQPAVGSYSSKASAMDSPVPSAASAGFQPVMAPV